MRCVVSRRPRPAPRIPDQPVVARAAPRTTLPRGPSARTPAGPAGSGWAQDGHLGRLGGQGSPPPRRATAGTARASRGRPRAVGAPRGGAPLPPPPPRRRTASAAQPPPARRAGEVRPAHAVQGPHQPHAAVEVPHCHLDGARPGCPSLGEALRVTHHGPHGHIAGNAPYPGCGGRDGRRGQSPPWLDVAHASDGHRGYDPSGNGEFAQHVDVEDAVPLSSGHVKDAEGRPGTAGGGAAPADLPAASS
jgi:hypothetical protein